MNQLTRNLIVGVTWAASLTRPSLAQSFIGLGDLPGGQFYSSASAVSDGGSVVVGSSSTGAQFYEAFQWISSDGMQSLGWLGQARAISADGLVVAGHREAANFTFEAVQWSSAAGLAPLGFVRPSHTRSAGTAASADGSVIVGFSNGGTPLQSDGFRWTQEGGMVGLGFLSPSHTYCTANGVSGDGSIVVGISRVSSSGSAEAFRWTTGAGMSGLGFLPGDNSSGAWAVSADGSTIIGGSFTIGGIGSEPFRWTQAGGMESLGFLPGYTTCDALGVSADGTIIVGACLSATTRAFIWTPSDGIRRLDSVLTNDYGLNLAGWQLITANAISPDGRAIVGYGINPSGRPEAFLAMLPAPCAGDSDGDGTIGLQDLAILLGHFGQAEGATAGDGDTDADGDVDLQDLATLLAAFGEAC